MFVSVGSLHFPFERLVSAAASLDVYDVVVQHGTAAPPRSVTEAMPYLSFDEMVRRMSAADLVVTHAGVGSVVLAMQLGHTPVVMARLARYGETVDDHQLALVERLGEQGFVLPIDDGGELEAALLRVPPRRAVRRPRATALHRAVKAALHA